MHTHKVLNATDTKPHAHSVSGWAHQRRATGGGTAAGVATCLGHTHAPQERRLRGHEQKPVLPLQPRDAAVACRGVRHGALAVALGGGAHAPHRSRAGSRGFGARRALGHSRETLRDPATARSRAHTHVAQNQSKAGRSVGTSRLTPTPHPANAKGACVRPARVRDLLPEHTHADSQGFGEGKWGGTMAPNPVPAPRRACRPTTSHARARTTMRRDPRGAQGPQLQPPRAFPTNAPPACRHALKIPQAPCIDARASPLPPPAPRAWHGPTTPSWLHHKKHQGIMRVRADAALHPKGSLCARGRGEGASQQGPPFVPQTGAFARLGAWPKKNSRRTPPVAQAKPAPPPRPWPTDPNNCSSTRLSVRKAKLRRGSRAAGAGGGRRTQGPLPPHPPFPLFTGFSRKTPG
jgi:hypothetical protein